MARKLKTYQTSLGFFDQAIAAPSMKAALEAWGADSNLFHQGAAKESHDPDVIAATLAKPGVVLRRPVGTDRPFSERAELSTDFGGEKPTTAARSPMNGKEEAARQKERERRQQAVDQAQAALVAAEQEHAQRAAVTQAEVETLEKRSQTEKARWDKEKQRLEAALRL